MKVLILAGKKNHLKNSKFAFLLSLQVLATAFAFLFFSIRVFAQEAAPPTDENVMKSLHIRTDGLRMTDADRLLFSEVLNGGLSVADGLELRRGNYFDYGANGVFAAPKNKAELCQVAKNIKDFRYLLFDPENDAYLFNQGGIGVGKLKTGLCWWQSRFVRFATYLSYFDPSQAMPTPDQIDKIIDQIIKGDHLVEIPGYKNFFEFSKANGNKIYKKLTSWEWRNTLGFQFTKGLAESNPTSATIQA
jgi:hypothetical protein